MLGRTMDRMSARRHLQKAVLARPSSLKPWVYLAIATVPDTLWPKALRARLGTPTRARTA
jgi:hypothetical protein